MAEHEWDTSGLIVPTPRGGFVGIGRTRDPSAWPGRSGAGEITVQDHGERWARWHRCGRWLAFYIYPPGRKRKKRQRRRSPSWRPAPVPVVTP